LDTVDLMADALVAMDEHALAIGWCNQAVALTARNAKAAAGRLWRAGRCYVRAGFRREAGEMLSAAVDALRAHESPLLAHALLDLGNAWLEAAPAQAEPAYREAAELWTTAGRANQAATAWVNLGVLCSRAGRLDEALEWYEKVRTAREDDPLASPAQRGNIHNNLASVWRRKGELARARAEAERALEILTPAKGPALANALGTMGEIARDEGAAEAALDWFRRARKQFERQPSPSLDGLSAKLENEAQALEALGREREAAKLRARMAELKVAEASSAPAPPPLSLSQPPLAARGVDGKTGGGASDGQVTIILDGRGLPDEVYSAHDLGTLEQRLETRLEREGGGELDGHEHGPLETQIFLYGPDARALFEVIAPVLLGYPLCRGARIELRQGDETTAFGLGDG
jgi:tetratricopeptide (TPR) repeat protein